MLSLLKLYHRDLNQIGFEYPLIERQQDKMPTSSYHGSTAAASLGLQVKATEYQCSISLPIAMCQVLELRVAYIYVHIPG